MEKAEYENMLPKILQKIIKSVKAPIILKVINVLIWI